MKKLIAGIIGTVLMASGLAATATSADAAAAPYPGTVKTRTIAVGLKAAKPHVAKVFVKVTSYGNGQPTGRLEFNFVKKANGKTYAFTRSYDGVHRYKFHGMQAGTYAVVVNFIPPDSSVNLRPPATPGSHARG